MTYDDMRREAEGVIEAFSGTPPYSEMKGRLFPAVKQARRVLALLGVVEAAEILAANAEIGPDWRMGGDVDTYYVLHEDLYALQRALRRAEEVE